MAVPFPEKLGQEVEGWVRDGLVTPEQAQGIRARYAAGSKETHGRTISAISWIGGSLVVVGIIVIVATNWQSMSDLVRTLLLVIVTAGLWGGGARLVTAKEYPAVGHALLLMGSGAFGGLIFQIANTYNLEPDNGALVGLWILGILPIAYGLRTFGPMVMAVLLMPIWIGLTFLNGANALDDGRSMVLTFVAGGILLCGAGLFHPRWRETGLVPPFQEVYLAGGALLVHIPSFVRTFAPTYALREPLFAGASPTITAAAVAFWAIAAIALAGGLMLHMRRGGSPWLAGLLGLGFVHALAVLVVPAGGADDVVYGALVVAWVVLAVQARQEMLFNLGLVLFVIMIVGRYIEFVADIQNPGWVFVAGGMILLAMAFGLEKLRRVMTQTIRQGGT